MSIVTEIKEDIIKLLKSNAFSGNEATAFKTSIYVSGKDDLELPGRACPAAYLDKLGLSTIEGDVAVMCPTTAGLVGELFNRGAKSVTCYEPRYLFVDCLNKSIALMKKYRKDDLIDDSTLTVEPNWPKAGDINKYDLILFVSGMDYSKWPSALITDTIGRIKSSGIMFIEFISGKSDDLILGNINSWKPTQSAFESLLEYFDNDIKYEFVDKGRFENSLVYKINRDVLDKPVINDNIEENALLLDSSLELEKKKKVIIDKGLFTEEELDKAVINLGESFLDEVLSTPKKVTRPKRARKPTKKATRKPTKRTIAKKKAAPTKNKQLAKTKTRRNNTKKGNAKG